MDTSMLAALDFGDIVMAYILKIIAAAVIFFVGRYLVKLVAKFIKRIMVKTNTDETLVGFTMNIVSIFLTIFVIIAALSALGIETTSLAAIIAAAGLAIGLALQGSLSNFAAGVVLILFRPFKVGDYVIAGGIDGTVQEISIFTTLLVSPDGVLKILPNGQITSREIVNYSTQASRRVDLEIGVAYNSDIDEVRTIITDILEKHDKILKDPAPTVAVGSLGDNAVNFIVRPHVANADYWDVKFEVTESIKKALDAAGVGIPFPQRDVHIHYKDTPKA